MNKKTDVKEYPLTPNECYTIDRGGKPSRIDHMKDQFDEVDARLFAELDEELQKIRDKFANRLQGKVIITGIGCGANLDVDTCRDLFYGQGTQINPKHVPAIWTVNRPTVESKDDKDE